MIFVLLTFMFECFLNFFSFVLKKKKSTKDVTNYV